MNAISDISHDRTLEHAVAMGLGVPTLGPDAEEGSRFAEVFGSRLDAPAARRDDPDRQARDAARDIVAAAFMLPVLKMMRAEPFKTDLFHGGQGEQTFGAVMDQHMAPVLAERIVPGLIDSVYRDFMGRYTPVGAAVDAEA